MKTQWNNADHKIKGLAIGATVLIFGLLSGVVYLHDSNTSLTAWLNKARLSEEILLSEKLDQEKKANAMDLSLIRLRQNHQELLKDAERMEQLLKARETEMDKLSSENRSLKGLRKEIAALRAKREVLESELAALSHRLLQAEEQGRQMEHNLTAAENSNRELREHLHIYKAVAAGNFRVNATRKSEDRITVSAKRARKVSVGFDLPVEMTSHVDFRIITPQGKNISGPENGLTFRIQENDAVFTAMAGDGVLEPVKENSRVEMTYEPRSRLEKGIYKIEILNHGSVVGSCQLKLR